MRSQKWLGVVAVAIVLVPFAVLLVRLAHGPNFSTSDLADIELRVRDVASRHTPLVGVYSRYGWNHPGPLLFDTLAIPYVVLGSNARALLAGAVLVNASAVAGAALLLWRRGRVAGVALGLVVLAVLVHALGGSVLVFPWNPYIIVLPMFLLALLVWSIACRDHWLLPAALAVASFLVQSHVGTTVAAAAMVAVAVAALLNDWRRRQAPAFVAVLITSLAVGIALWLPPLFDQFDGSGNLGDLWRYWTTKHTPTVGYGSAARIVSNQLSLPAPWITRQETINVFTSGVVPAWHFPFALVLLLAATVIAWMRRDRTAFTLAVVALTFLGAALVSVAHIVDVPFPYIIRWTWCAGALAWLAVGWTTIALLRTVRAPTLRRVALTVAAVTVIALTTATTIDTVHSEYPDPGLDQAMHALYGPTLAAARAAPQPILIQSTPDLAAPSIASGLLVKFSEQGVDAGIAPSLANMVGKHHTVPSDRARSTLLVGGNNYIADLARDPQNKLIATFDRLSPSERAFYDPIDQLLSPMNTRDRAAWVDAHPAEARRYNALTPRSLRAAVFLVPTLPSANPG